MIDSETTLDVLREVALERTKQDKKWGEQNHPWYQSKTIWSGLTLADTAKYCVDIQAKTDTLDFAGILTEEYLEAIEETDVVNARIELIQVAAVAVAAIESIDRNGR